MKCETRDIAETGATKTRKSPAPNRVPRLVFRVAIAAALLSAVSACTIEPWVKPYERAALADPIMAAARNPVAEEYLHHVHEVREGARGASGSAGGGCGCN